MIKEYFHLVSRNIINRKLRVALTVIGIIVAITAIVSLLTLSRGLENAIEQQLEELGGNSLNILSGSFSIEQNNVGDGLTIDDLDAVESVSAIDYATGFLQEFLVVEYKGESKVYPINGIKADEIERALEDYRIVVEQGKAITQEGEGVIIGNNVANDGFNRTINVNNKILIDGESFKVIGIFEKQNNPDVDNSIYISLEDLRELVNEPTAISYIDARVKRGLDINASRDRVKERLEKIRDESTFVILTSQDLLATFNNIFGIVRTTLLSIAAISLIVGTVGIANAIYSSVVERTSQIGVMKALGATRENILHMYILEAAVIGLFGGVIGSILGNALAFLVEQSSRSSGFDLFNVEVEPLYLLIGIGIAVLSGVAAGIMPARQAAQLHPVIAMRKK